MTDKLTFRELHGIPRDPGWPHVEGCEGGCFGCMLEDVVLEAGGTDGRAFLMKHMLYPGKPKAPPVQKPAAKKK